MPFCRLPDVCSSSPGSYSVIPSDVFVCSSTSSSSASSSTSLPSYLQATCILRFKVCLILSCLVLLALSCLVLSCLVLWHEMQRHSRVQSSSKGRMRGRFYHRERFLLWRCAKRVVCARTSSAAPAARRAFLPAYAPHTYAYTHISTHT
jgi:hypothetical protein